MAAAGFLHASAAAAGFFAGFAAAAAGFFAAGGFFAGFVAVGFLATTSAGFLAPSLGPAPRLAPAIALCTCYNSGALATNRSSS